jgi:gamma-glutamyl:cysteine ligase YbdK (ATP-grasp superfamily)
MGQDFSFGIEEEYFLVDADTKAIIPAMPKPFLEAAKKAVSLGSCGQVTSEMLQAQIEVATAPHTDMKAAREELRHSAPHPRRDRSGARACNPRRRHPSDRVVARCPPDRV